jgi:hypothetical protein
MTEASRAVRAFRDHETFERLDDDRFEATTTAFDAVVEAIEVEGRVEFDLTIRAPSLSAAVEDEVAPVVEEGWLETFELRVADADGVASGDHDFEPRVRLTDSAVIVEVTFTDINERRGVDDAAAVVNYVEGTYVQGIIPGYEYTGEVAQLIDRARGQ